MVIVLQGIGGLLFIGQVICFVLVVMKMFQNDDKGLGIASIVTFFICCLGLLFTFIMGWVNSAKYDVKNIMLAWTACWVGSIIVNGLVFAMGGGAAANGM